MTTSSTSSTAVEPVWSKSSCSKCEPLKERLYDDENIPPYLDESIEEGRIMNPQRMNPVSCPYRFIEFLDLNSDGDSGRMIMQRIPYGDPYDRMFNGKDRCHGCGVPVGNIHHATCEAETCPYCRNQLFSCTCCLTELSDFDLTPKIIHENLHKPTVYDYVISLDTHETVMVFKHVVLHKDPPKDCKPLTPKQALAVKPKTHWDIVMSYGTDKEELGPPSPGWDTKKVHMLLKQLYLEEITIEQFKEEFTKAGMNYNWVEHCCGCAGCYEAKSHMCPDYHRIDREDYDPDKDTIECKIRDPIYCDICEERVKRGVYHMVHVNKEDGKIIDVDGDSGYYDDMDDEGKSKKKNVTTLEFLICDKDNDSIIDWEKDGAVSKEGYKILASLVEERRIMMKDNNNIESKIFRYSLTRRQRGLVENALKQEHRVYVDMYHRTRKDGPNRDKLRELIELYEELINIFGGIAE